MGPNRKEKIVSNKPKDCTDCEFIKSCTVMCTEVEFWVEQDVVGRNSTLLLQNRPRGERMKGVDDFLDYHSVAGYDVMHPDTDTSQAAWSEVCDMRLSDKVIRFIYSYYMLGKRIRDIAIDESSTSQAIDQRHIQAKKSIGKRLEQRVLWMMNKDIYNYQSVRDYDVCYLFYSEGYPRKVIAKILGIHVSTVIKIISKKNGELAKAEQC